MSGTSEWLCLKAQRGSVNQLVKYWQRLRGIDDAQRYFGFAAHFQIASGEKKLKLISDAVRRVPLRGRIQLTMIWQEAEYLEQLESIERDCRKVPPLLISLAQRRGKAALSPEVTSLLSMVEAIARRCGQERETLGLWREDGLDPDEVIEEIENELEEVVQTLNATFPASRS